MPKAKILIYHINDNTKPIFHELFAILKIALIISSAYVGLNFVNN